jgi:tetratricopeptide (TPR) repeat protein
MARNHHGWVSMGLLLILGTAWAASSDEPDIGLVRLAQASSAPPTESSTLQEAQTLLSSGRAREAYELLSAHEADWAGAPLFDYLLGMAALDSGRPDEAVFSLERVLAAEPAFAGARMELARAHYEAGELAAARTQFEYLLTQSPPASTRVVIERYLDQIYGRGRVAGGGMTPFFELGAGYDSNANGSTSDANFLGFTLDPNNVETSSPFFELAAGLGHIAPLRESAAWLNSVRLSHRFNPDADFIDQSIAALNSTFSWARDRNRASVGASGYYSLLDGEDHEWGASLDLGFGRRITDAWDLGLSLRGGAVRYEDELLTVMDVDRYLAALALSRLNIGTRGGRVTFTLLGSVDEEKEADSPYGNERLGGRISGGWLLSPQSSVYLEGGYLETQYDDEVGFFGTDRDDEEWSALLATEHQNWPGKGWTLTPRLRYVEHSSNISLYEYDRWEASLYARRSFR